MRIFIAGIMQGSIKGKGIGSQDYRERIRQIIIAAHPDYETFDPFSLFPDSVEYDKERARTVLLKMADEAGKSDAVVAYLPAASMGTALEMIRAYDNHKPVISISPMERNWVIWGLSSVTFPDLDSFEIWVKEGRLAKLLSR